MRKRKTLVVCERCHSGNPRGTGNSYYSEMITGERYAGKLARTVREGAVGKGPEPRAPRRRPTSLCRSPGVQFSRATRSDELVRRQVLSEVTTRRQELCHVTPTSPDQAFYPSEAG